MGERDPSLARRLVTVADVEGAAPDERRRFYDAAPVRADGPEADEIVRRLAEHGADTSTLDRVGGIRRGVPGDDPSRARCWSPRARRPSFVYVPTGAGPGRPAGRRLRPSPLHPWVPVGTTGVIRRAERNSEIVAEREVDVIMIPGELYARAWLRPLGVDELVARLSARPAPV